MLKLTWVPNTFDCFCFTSQNAWGTVFFRIARSARVLYFFSMVFFDCCHGFVFKVNELGLQFKCFLRAFFYTIATATTFV